MTDKEVKALLSPLISFDLKTPIQAYTDTLPPKLKDAILNHHVMVGMTTDMVMFALGQPDRRSARSKARCRSRSGSTAIRRSRCNLCASTATA